MQSEHRRLFKVGMKFALIDRRVTITELTETILETHVRVR